MTHDDKRDGTADLFAAMILATGQVLTHLPQGPDPADHRAPKPVCVPFKTKGPHRMAGALVVELMTVLVVRVSEP
jgi:hypothetical protein